MVSRRSQSSESHSVANGARSPAPLLLANPLEIRKCPRRPPRLDPGRRGKSRVRIVSSDSAQTPVKVIW
jgi:hypothetical protein